MSRRSFVRFMSKVNEAESGCWLWTATLNNKGYAQFGDSGKVVLGHRWAYEHFVGPIPEGLNLDHLCCTKRCVHPRHVEPVTHVENIRRAMALKTHCPHGHDYTPENTRLVKGARTCIICTRARDRARRPARGCPIKHGTKGGYTNRGCRCALCTVANAASNRARRARLKALNR